MTTTIFYAILSALIFCASIVVLAGILEAAKPSREWESENAFTAIEPIRTAMDGKTFENLNVCGSTIRDDTRISADSPILNTVRTEAAQLVQIQPHVHSTLADANELISSTPKQKKSAKANFDL